MKNKDFKDPSVDVIVDGNFDEDADFSALSKNGKFIIFFDFCHGKHISTVKGQSESRINLTIKSVDSNINPKNHFSGNNSYRVCVNTIWPDHKCDYRIEIDEKKGCASVKLERKPNLGRAYLGQNEFKGMCVSV